MEKRIIYIDVDEVCAQLHIVWFNHYNKDYDDNLKLEDVTEWEVEKFVKPECGMKIYNYIKDPKLYDEVIPVPGALEGVDALREMGYRVLFSTSCAAKVMGRKFYWLKQYGFIEKERDYIEIRDKSLLMGDYMFDDCYSYINGFKGLGCLLTKPWNKNYSWDWRVNDWNEYISQMKEET